MISTNQQRYLVALPRGNQRVFLSWRLLASDRPDAPFHVERRRGPGDTWQRVTSAPVVDSTTFLDHAPEAAGYEYRVLADGDTPSEIVTIDAGAPASMIAFDIPLDPEDAVEDIALGDLTNSGRMGYVLRAARAGTVWLVAYRYDGKLLWECDTRLPARGGWDGSTRHVPVLCWDVNGDGRTEVAFHTCRGTYPGDLYE